MTDTPELVLDATDPTPPYEQLRVQLAVLIRSGELTPNQRLPPLRQLANDLGLAVGTVGRTYRELERAGLVRSRRGGGTRVAESVPVMSEAERDRRIAEHAAGYAQAVGLLGVSPPRALDAVRRALDGGPQAGARSRTRWEMTVVTPSPRIETP